MANFRKQIMNAGFVDNLLLLVEADPGAAAIVDPLNRIWTRLELATFANAW